MDSVCIIDNLYGHHKDSDSPTGISHDALKEQCVEFVFPFAQVAVACLLQVFLHFFIDFVCLGRRQGKTFDDHDSFERVKVLIAHLKFDIAPESRTFQKKIHCPTIIFLGAAVYILNIWGVTIYTSTIQFYKPMD